MSTMRITLREILELVGNLDDTTGENTPRERFRRLLRDSITEVGQLRDFVVVCLNNTGAQYNRALQDIVNRIGTLLGFEVTYGRYQGVQGEIGHDGLWKSPTNFNIVVEVKTSEIFAITTATLLGYINGLVSNRTIPSRDNTLGLYVIGRVDPETRQLENSIIAERNIHQLRIISVDSLLTLAELMSQYDVSHDDVLALLKPASPTVDPIAQLIGRLVAQPHGETEGGEIVPPNPVEPKHEVVEGKEGEIAAYWITPVQSDDEQSAEQVIRTLVGNPNQPIYALRDNSPARRHLRVGDKICFYESGTGVAAHATVSSLPVNEPNTLVGRHANDYPWTFRLDDCHLYLDNPVVIDLAKRAQLQAFRGRDLNNAWAWFVQGTHKIERVDFEQLTRT